MPAARVYWWKGVPNFGDALTPALLRRFSRLEAEYSPIRDAQLVSTGSVLEHIPPFWSGCIVGSGRLRENSRLSLGSGSPTVMAIRGPLSARGIKGTFALGDPGLLADELVTVETKRYALGIVPHWSDTELATDPRFARYNPKIIDPRGDPLDVIRTIGECRKIVASSLHGIIVADAFGIPRRFEYTPRFDREGGTFKFRDYSASIRTPFQPGVTMEANRFHVEDRKHELYDVFRALGARFK